MLSECILMKGIAVFSTNMVFFCMQKGMVSAKRNSMGVHETHKNFEKHLL